MRFAKDFPKWATIVCLDNAASKSFGFMKHTPRMRSCGASSIAALDACALLVAQYASKAETLQIERSKTEGGWINPQQLIKFGNPNCTKRVNPLAGFVCWFIGSSFVRTKFARQRRWIDVFGAWVTVPAITEVMMREA